ncbi:C45 family autoproteolytic acyltransferase/hydolase [Agromyces tropicus]|uniref:C45 family autoproteolytic acyltransferase/hydolase n=1 Tax=Agromyces tropicus TaxID=555371 RepID=A0ABP5G259_9MICO
MTITVSFTTATTPFERGRSFGAANAADLRANWEGYRAFFGLFDLSDAAVREVADGCRERLAGWAPDLAIELDGLAEGAGLERWETAAMTARSEVVAPFRAPGECSTAIHLPEGAPPRTLQTWDWNDRMTEGKVVHRYATSAGRTVTTFTEFGILAKIGVTDAGLGVHFNLLQHDADGGEPGVPVHAVARRILDEATTVDDAEAIARSAPVSASVVFSVVTWDGERADAAAIECSPVGVARVPVGDRGHLWHSNHFVDAGLATGERLGAIDPDTYERFDELARRIDALESPDLAERASAFVAHAEDGAALCCHPDPDVPAHARWRTQAMVSLDVAAARLHVRDGTPCVGDLREWLVV